MSKSVHNEILQNLDGGKAWKLGYQEITSKRRLIFSLSSRCHRGSGPAADSDQYASRLCPLSRIESGVANLKPGDTKVLHS